MEFGGGLATEDGRGIEAMSLETGASKEPDIPVILWE